MVHARIPPVSYGQKVLFWENRAVQREILHVQAKSVKKVKKSAEKCKIENLHICGIFSEKH